jgi:peroxiredoxin
MRLAVIVFAFFFSFQLGAQNRSIPDFTLLDAQSNEEVNLMDYIGSKAVVVIFTSNYCPFSKQYIDRINALDSNYSSKGVQILLINSNSESDNPEESVDEMKKKSNEHGFQFPYLADKDRVALALFEASRTPEVFLLQPIAGKFQVVYQGAIDDSPQLAEEVRNPFLVNALEEVLSGQKVTRNYVRPTGCIIKN